jgi:subtilase family serine protease
MKVPHTFVLRTAQWAALVGVLGMAAGHASMTQSNGTERVKGDINDRTLTRVPGQVHPQAQRVYDHGRVADQFTLERITMMFKLTGSQQANLDALLKQQQTPGSPNYHKWLTPEEFGDQFGISPADLQKIVSWIESKGFTVNETARGRMWITFTGAARLVESTFHTEIHEYAVDGKNYYANATDPLLPDAIATVVLGFRSLHNFPLKPRILHSKMAQFTSSITGNHFLTPDDFATIYNIKAAYGAGLDGTGQTIAVMGQTDIVLNDIRTFRSVSGLPVNDPGEILVPSGSNPGIVDDDMVEADLDLEWAGAVAPKANILYVNSSNGVLDSLQYTIDQNLAPVLSISYGDCEQSFSPADLNTLAVLAQQANAQGITIVAPSGDAGPADCDGNFPARQLARLGYAVDAPGSLPYVTAVGGTTLYELPTSWSTSNNLNNGSALSYIPEVVWNDTLLLQTGTLAASGGGKSIYFPKPAWQLGPGVPRDGARDVPDVSLAASLHDGYLICTQGSCVNGYRSGDDTLFSVGGTSAAVPAFAAVLALINQRMMSAQGNVNPVLYQLAILAPSVFHDITTGLNWVPCQPRTRDCPNGGFLGYSATRGYDLATGLGSVDVSNLIAAWPLLLP